MANIAFSGGRKSVLCPFEDTYMPIFVRQGISAKFGDGQV